MKNVLPVPISETYTWDEYEEIFYHNGKKKTKYGRVYSDKSDNFNNHKYKTIIKYKTAIIKDEYKSYNIATPKKVIVDITTTEI